MFEERWLKTKLLFCMQFIDENKLAEKVHLSLKR